MILVLFSGKQMTNPTAIKSDWYKFSFLNPSSSITIRTVFHTTSYALNVSPLVTVDLTH